MDIFSGSFIDRTLYISEQNQPKTSSSKVKKMEQLINDVRTGDQSQAQMKYCDLFWNATTKKAIDVTRKKNESETDIQIRLLAEEYNPAIADFLFGQVMLADDNEKGEIKDDSLALLSFQSAFNQGFKPAEDSLVSWCFTHYHPENTESFFTDTENSLGNKLALNVLTTAAKHGNPTAHYLLGVLNLRNAIDHSSLNNAVHHFKLAYELGHQQWSLTAVEAKQLFDQAELLWKTGDKWVFNSNEAVATALYNIAAKAGNQAAIQKANELFQVHNAPGLFDTFWGNRAKFDPLHPKNINT
jgi:hypothetical protein